MIFKDRNYYAFVNSPIALKVGLNYNKLSETLHLFYSNKNVIINAFNIAPFPGVTES